MSTKRRGDDRELGRLQAEAVDRDRDIREMREMRGMREREQRQGVLIARLRRDAGVREQNLAALRERLGAAEHGSRISARSTMR
jgi:hypothetical protein